MSIRIITGDCVEQMALLPAASVDSIVTDPPYGLGFMGKAWDSFKAGDSAMRRRPEMDAVNAGMSRQGGRQRACADYQKRQARDMQEFQAWCETWAEQCLRVLKPGGHLLAFSGTRTYHRMVCAIEDAGFEVRDMILYHYGSGFPKSSRVNRDERFCQCGASADTSSRTSPEQPRADRKRKAGASVEEEHGAQSALHGLHTVPSSPAGCRGEHGSDGESPRPEPSGVLAFPPSPECVPTHTRSGGLCDDPGAAPSRSPSPAQCTDRPSNQGSRSPSGDPASLDDGNGSSSTPRLETGSDNGKRALDTSGKGGILSAWPHCIKCGKPDANGWGTALKPATEPIVLARKPLQGTVAANVLKHGTGALNIDGCRIEVTDASYARNASGDRGHDENRKREMEFGMTAGKAHDLGRWPANVITDGSEEVIAAFPQDGKVGDGRVKISAGGANRAVSGSLNPSGMNVAGKENIGIRGFGDGGSAARFFYTAKASRHDRNDGLHGMPEKPLLWSSGEQNPGAFQSPNTKRAAQNNHPTVKPTDLMRYLCRLVTPPGGMVLDPFAGSGSTLKAAELEGFNAIGIELDPAYVEIARRRIASDAPLFAEVAA